MRLARSLVLISPVALAIALTACASSPAVGSISGETSVARRLDRDTGRSRYVPSLIYRSSVGRPLPLAILSHGYGAAPEDYAFLADALARQGYVVASIDHELPGDPPLPSTGNVRTDRTPSWQASVQSIRLVRDALITAGIAEEGPVVLVGHSHGGDASMMMATEYPAEVRAVFSLDNRRYPLPRNPGIRVCSLRSSDQSADAGVLPSRVERAGLDVRITEDPDLAHDDMSEVATGPQKARMIDALLACLR